MKYLSSFWVKIILAIIGGAIMAEVIDASAKGNIIKPFLFWIWVGIVYFILTGIVWVYNWNHAKNEE